MAFRMSRRLSLAASLLLAPAFVSIAGQIYAQPLPAAPFNSAPVATAPAVSIPVDSDDAIARLSAQGQKLETERKWGEALLFWEDALRDHPHRADFKERLGLARIHYDLGRRYADASFLKQIETASERVALEIYAEVLTKISTYYVGTPEWRDLVWRGTANLDAALTDPIFINKHLKDVPVESITEMRRQLRRVMLERKVATREEARDLVSSIARLVAMNLRISPVPVIAEYTCGAIGALDRFSSFLTGGQLDDVYSQIEGNFVGIGIELKADQDSLLLVHIIPGSPAEAAGLKAQERIVRVSGRTTKDLTTDKAADMLRGEEGTFVDIEVQNPAGEKRPVRIARRRVEVPSVEEVKISDPAQGIGYFRITSFQKNTSREVDAALWKLHREGMKSLIIDLRGNPGGLLTASVEVADKFVDEGMIVSTRGRSPREDYDYKGHKVGTWGVPLVVLVDRDSASASEIFAGAIQDQRRGTIVGQKSYGKGSVQGIFPLESGAGGLRLTTAKFYTPNGRAISEQGVTPDVPVTVVAKPVVDASKPSAETAKVDATLEAALQVAKRNLAAVNSASR